METLIVDPKTVKFLYDMLSEDNISDLFYVFLRNKESELPLPVVVSDDGYRIIDGAKRIALSDTFERKAKVYLVDKKDIYENKLQLNDDDLFVLKNRYLRFENGSKSSRSLLELKPWYLQHLSAAKKYFQLKSFNMV